MTPLRLYRPCAALLGLLCLAAAAPAVPDGPAEVKRLVEQLGDPSFEKREAASQRLAAAGEGALEALGRAAESDDREVRRRARDLVARIRRATHAELRSFAGHHGCVWAVARSADGKRLLSGGDDKALILWD